MDTEIINMTAHDITIINADNETIQVIKPSGNTIRLSMETVSAGFSIDGVPITKTQFGDVVGLPPYKFKIYYVVSQMVKNRLPDRYDLLVPAEVKRNEKGVILGCMSLGI